MSTLSFQQRLHNALGSQEVENVKAVHAYLHAMNHSAEEWGTIWSKSENATWAHFFGRMVGFDQVWYGSVPYHDGPILRKFVELGEKYPEIYNLGIDIRGIGYCGGLHILANSIIEVAEDGLSARAFYLTPGGTGDILDNRGSRQSGILWERYGSDFVYEDGKWLYLHEHVCPDIMSPGAFDKNNWGRDAYLRSLREEPERPAGGSPPCTDPGPLHQDYSITQTVQNTVPWPIPYKTLDDENSYAPGHNPVSAPVHVQEENEDGEADVPEPFRSLGKPVQLDGEYTVQILAPPGLPAHTAVFQTENGVLKGTYKTEHSTMALSDLEYADGHVTWTCMAGSHGDERFRFSLKPFFGGILLGATWRIDTGRPGPESPVSAKRKE